MAIEFVNVVQYKEFGEKVAQWTRTPASRPQTLADLKTECAGMLEIPARIKKLRYVDDDLDTLVIRFPNEDMLAEAMDRVSSVPPPYVWAPSYYRLIGANNQPPNLDILYMRLADYVIAQCA